MAFLKISEKWFELGNNQYGTHVLQEQDGEDIISFVDHVSYHPAKDDDFEFSIRPIGTEQYQYKTQNGNNKSLVQFRISQWRLPGYVSQRRFSLVPSGEQDWKHYKLSVPLNHKGVIISEMLSYLPDGDDDFSYLTRAFSMGNAGAVIALSDYGRKSSNVTFRFTVLEWPEDKPVRVEQERLYAIGRGSSSQRDFRGNEGLWIITPTMYMTDTTEYIYGQLNDEAQLRKALTRKGTAGAEELDWWGILGAGEKKAMEAGEHLAQKDYGKAAEAAVEGAVPIITTALKEAFGKKPDERDDDFSLEVKSGRIQGGYDDTFVRVVAADGNDYSLGEMTLYRISDS